MPALTSPTKINLDNGAVDTPAQARAELATNVDSGIAVVALLNSGTAGQVLTANGGGNASTMQAIPLPTGGSSGQVLTSNGASPSTFQTVASIFSLEATSSEITISTAGFVAFAHSLGVTPKITQMHIICKTAEHNYSIGDTVLINPMENIGSAGSSNVLRGNAAVFDAWNVSVRFGNSTTPIGLIDKTTGNHVSMTLANWKLVIKVYA